MNDSKILQELLECLKWYVEEDDVNDSEEANVEEWNAYWIRGKRRAEKAIEAADNFINLKLEITNIWNDNSLSESQKYKTTLLKILNLESHPNTIADICLVLNRMEIYHLRSSIARGIWNLCDEGKVNVFSGKIYPN